jgi:hypothetical protein
MTSSKVWRLLVLLGGSYPATQALPQETSSEELAMQLANPIASLISVPFQLNYDRDLGPADGDRRTLNIQPVVPISLNERWNLISRTVLPVVSADEIVPGAGGFSGTGDTVQSLFFSPTEPVNGWIVGYGPVFLIPTGTDDRLTADQWGAGPTGVALKQNGPWTYGVLANHIWSVAGNSNRPDVSATFLQPFLSYTTPAAVTYSVNMEATYDWEADESTVPLSVGVSKVVTIGRQVASIGTNLRYYASAPDNGPDGVALRFTFTLLYPRG